MAILGPSGSGKSTLLRCMNRLEEIDAGSIVVEGETLVKNNEKGEAQYAEPEQARKILARMGMVFQQFNLFPHMTVIENLMAAPKIVKGMSEEEIRPAAEELLKKVGLYDKRDVYPGRLSGGQQQRVAIARALAMRPDILLFDEPTSALDPTMVGEVQAVIRELAHMGKTMMIVTHEMKFAREICNRVFYMDQGGIYEDGTPEQIFDHPQKERTRRFIRQLKVFETLIDSPGFDFIEAAASIERYGFQNRIAPKTVYRIQSVFEELCQQILLPVLDEPQIRFTAEYDEAAEQASLTVLYNGPIFDPQATENTLSWQILTNAAEGIGHEAITDAPYTNALYITIKK